MNNYSPEKHKNEYLFLHTKRFKFLLELIGKYSNGKQLAILDIGRSPFTKLLLERYSNLTTMGLDINETLLDKADPVDFQIVPHIIFNLNDCSQKKLWYQGCVFDIIVFSEVLEHLSVDTNSVFQFLNSCLVDGGILICQTPNAVSFSKRIKMVFGKNPFQKFEKEKEAGQHHFREFTKNELTIYGKENGFEIVEHYYKNYFSYSTFMQTIINNLASIIPFFRNGQTIVYKKINHLQN
jgi:trans-aconitate methyltransferase